MVAEPRFLKFSVSWEPERVGALPRRILEALAQNELVGSVLVRRNARKVGSHVGRCRESQSVERLLRALDVERRPALRADRYVVLHGVVHSRVGHARTRVVELADPLVVAVPERNVDCRQPREAAGGWQAVQGAAEGSCRNHGVDALHVHGKAFTVQ